MKLSEFKQLIKESAKQAVKEVFQEDAKTIIREAFQEEMKDILLEAVRGGGSGTKTSIVENKTSKQKIKEVLDETAFKFSSGNVQQPFVATGGPGSTLAEGSALPAGEVNLEQIMGLIKK